MHSSLLFPNPRPQVTHVSQQHKTQARWSPDLAKPAALRTHLLYGRWTNARYCTGMKWPAGWVGQTAQERGSLCDCSRKPRMVAKHGKRQSKASEPLWTMMLWVCRAWMTGAMVRFLVWAADRTEHWQGRKTLLTENSKRPLL